jgi:hypothetical protein
MKYKRKTTSNFWTRKIVALLAVLAAEVILIVLPIVTLSNPAAPNPGHSWSQMECDANLCVSGGSVGIGTTNPQATLEIVGNGSGNFSDFPALVVLNQTDSNPWALLFQNQQAPNNFMAFWTEDYGELLLSNATHDFMGWNSLTGEIWIGPTDNYIDIAPSGNVGIRTTSPNYLLEIANNSKALNVSGVLYVNGTSGNVGIGTTSPAGKIDVNATLTTAVGWKPGIQATIILDPAANGAHQVDGLYLDVETPTTNSKNITGGYLSGIGTDADHYGSGTLTELYGIWTDVDNQGTGTVTNAYGSWFSVGTDGPIGTAYGSYVELYTDTIGTIGTAYGVYIEATSGGANVTNNYGLYIQDQSGAGSTNSFNLYSRGSGSKNYFEGNVGIGTTSPSYKLQLSTDSAAKPSTNTWTIASDARIKTDIRNFTDGLSVIEGINPVWYQYNGKGGFAADGKDYIGVVAQDIKKVAPYTVDTYKAKLNPNDTNETELLNFNSHALTFVLANSVKELENQIHSLQNENQQLKALVCQDHPQAEICTR